MTIGGNRPARVLLVDDEPSMLHALGVLIPRADYEIFEATTVNGAEATARAEHPDVAVVDLLLPDGTGTDLIKRLRTWSQLPIIILSAVRDQEAKVSALLAGADDYVTKPVGSKELLARLVAVLRRVPPGQEPVVLRAGGLELDPMTRTVTCDGVAVRLTGVESRLLHCLMRQQGGLLSHRTLLAQVWGPGRGDDLAVLRTTIARLRSKVDRGDGPPRIRTEAGLGYRVEG